MKLIKVILIGGLFLSVSTKSYSLTQAEAETRVRQFVRDSPASGLYRYSDTFIDGFLNQAQRELVNDTWCLQTSGSITLVAGTSYYSMPSDLIAPKMVRIKDASNKNRNLSETSYKAVTQNNPDYERQTGPPMQYAVRTSTSGGTALEVVFLPIATVSSTGTVTIDYYNQSTDLSSDSSVYLDGDLTLYPYHENIVYNAVAKLKLIENDTAGAQAFFQLYQAGVQAMNSRLGEKPNLTPGFTGGGPGISSGSPNR